VRVIDILLTYLAGPYTDLRGSRFVELNIRAAEEVALQLWGFGYSVLCPHTNTRHFDGAHPYDTWLAGDFEQIRRCDLVVVLPRYETSSGTKREMLEAGKNNIPLFFWDVEADRQALESFSHNLIERM